MDKAWKRAERQVAKFFGVNRTPLSGGSGRITRSDTLHQTLFIETKYFSRDRFNSVDMLFKLTAGMAKVEHKTPVVCLKKSGMSGFLILVKESDLIDVAVAIAEDRQRRVNPEFEGEGLVSYLKEEKCPK